MHLHVMLHLVRLHIGAGEGGGAGDLAEAGLIAAYGRDSLAPGVPEVLLVYVTAKLKDHGTLRPELRLYRLHAEHHEAALALAIEIEAYILERHHADQIKALDLRILAQAAVPARLSIQLVVPVEVVAAEEQLGARQSDLVLAQTHAVSIHQCEGTLHHYRLVDLLVFGE